MRSGFSTRATANPLFDSHPYADLPDEVLQQVLGKTAEVAEGVRALFSRVDERRAAMRDLLVREGRIRSSADLPQPVTLPTVAAVDGGAAIEKALGTDTALAVAVGIEGLTDAPISFWPGVQYAAWQKTLPHEGDATTSACRGVMTALELEVARHAPHDLILLDGAHLTPIIGLNAMLAVTQDALRDEIAEVVARHDTAEALVDVMTRPACVAVVKYDSSRDLAHTWLPPELRGPGLGLDDRTLMTLLLEPGEYTAPQSVALTQQSKSNWLTKHIEALTPGDAEREKVRVALNEVITLVRHDQLLVTYYKPHAWAHAFRLEIKPAVALDPSQMGMVLAGIRSQVVSPEIREPYPQWVADRMAKSVGDALVALRTAVNFDLADAGMGEYVALTSQSYRTDAM